MDRPVPVQGADLIRAVFVLQIGSQHCHEEMAKKKHREVH